LDTTILTELAFGHPFRKYQQMILDQVGAAEQRGHKFHIVSPPGSGKTIVGLELIRRFGHPAVIFSPTSTIQLQWQERLAMFIPDHSSLKTSEISSTSPQQIRLFNSYTYQLISTQSENIDFVVESAIEEWKDDMLAKDVTVSLEEATDRIQKLQKNNPSSYKSNLSRYYKKLKDRYWKDPTLDAWPFLHANARRLIDDLVAAGVKTIVLDEVHHLLDYWAFVIKELARRIGDDVYLIGLTATPPLSASSEGMENYLSIMGSIDFEVPTPAVVKEGNLAPYQDLVYFCRPTDKEKKFIDSLESRFREIVERLGAQESFGNWVWQRVVERPLPTTDGKQSWTAFFNRSPSLAIAGVKYLTQGRSLNLPWDIVEIEETDQPIDLDDWVTLLSDYALNYLKVSSDPAHHEELKEIRAVLKSFGFTLTERGIRQHRTPSSMILSLSESKDKAMIRVLRAEMQAMKEKLRVVVMTDFEKQSATVAKHLEGILDPEAGGAVRAFRYIVEDEETTKLEPALVTGSSLLLDRDELEEIRDQMGAWRERSGLNFDFVIEDTQYHKIVRVKGSGPDWKSNTYVRMVTDLFDRGVIRCIVGTRGLLGEGWDSLGLNTLIDLTSATTSMTVNQIRGRSIRLDPKWPEKVANNWDIVCIEPGFQRGKEDFNRFARKHRKFFGLSDNGRIVKGLLHVDESLLKLTPAFLQGDPFESTFNEWLFGNVSYQGINQKMLSRAGNRDKAYQKWGIGEPYANFEFSATKLEARDLKFQTVYTLRDTLRAILNRIVLLVGGFLAYSVAFIHPGIYLSSLPAFWVVATLIMGGILYFAGRDIRAYIRKGFIELPYDSFVLDIGKALLQALRESEQIAGSQSVDNVRVSVDLQGYYDVHMDYATVEDARTFSQALRQVLAPVAEQRYLVSRSEDNIRLGFYSPLWWIFRKLFRLIRQEKVAYHPVPDILAVNKTRAEIFARCWRERVGGGDLIYTRSEAGREKLMQLRRRNHHKIKRFTYQVWQ